MADHMVSYGIVKKWVGVEGRVGGDGGVRWFWFFPELCAISRRDLFLSRIEIITN